MRSTPAARSTASTSSNSRRAWPELSSTQAAVGSSDAGSTNMRGAADASGWLSLLLLILCAFTLVVLPGIIIMKPHSCTSPRGILHSWTNLCSIAIRPPPPPPPHASIVHTDERRRSDSYYMGNTQWPMVHTRQCPHKDGFYSAMRSLLPLIFFAVSLASHTNEINVAMPDLWYDEQVSGQTSRFRGPVPFLKIYDGHHLRHVLRGAGVTNARSFYDCEAPKKCRKVRLSASACRQSQQPDMFRGDCWRGHLWNETQVQCLPGSAAQLAELLAGEARLSKSAPAHYLLDGAALIDTHAPWTAWVRNFERSARWTGDHDDRMLYRMRMTEVNASYDEPWKINGLPSTAVIRAFDALRAAPAVRRAADFLIQSYWGLAGERFIAYHLRRGSTYALPDRAAVMRDVKAFGASNRTGLPGGTNISTAYQHFLGHTLTRMDTGQGVDWHGHEINHLYQEGPAEMVGALRRALLLADEPTCQEEAAAQGRTAVRYVVLSTFLYAQPAAAKVLASARKELTVLTFDPAAWAAVRDASIHGWDPDEPLMLDAVETEVWMRAAVFIGGQSTMAAMTKIRRHAMRGMGYDGASRACVVNSQPCPSDPKIDLESEARLACR